MHYGPQHIGSDLVPRDGKALLLETVFHARQRIVAEVSLLTAEEQLSFQPLLTELKRALLRLVEEQ